MMRQNEMIDREQFDLIGRKHGGYGSWAVWAAASEKTKSNVGDLSVFDLAANPGLLASLRNDIVMVGLNFSRSVSKQFRNFRNFHDPSPRANDFKIRYAFANTIYHGAYMTDIVKNFPMLKSAAVIKHLRGSLPSLSRT